MKCWFIVGLDKTCVWPAEEISVTFMGSTLVLRPPTEEDAASGKLDWKNRRAEKEAPLKLNKLESIMAFNTAKGVVGAKALPHYPAPMEAIRVIEETAHLPTAEALQTEHE